MPARPDVSPAPTGPIGLLSVMGRDQRDGEQGGNTKQCQPNQRRHVEQKDGGGDNPPAVTGPGTNAVFQSRENGDERDERPVKVVLQQTRSVQEPTGSGMHQPRLLPDQFQTRQQKNRRKKPGRKRGQQKDRARQVSLPGESGVREGWRHLKIQWSDGDLRPAASSERETSPRYLV